MSLDMILSLYNTWSYQVRKLDLGTSNKVIRNAMSVRLSLEKNVE